MACSISYCTEGFNGLNLLHRCVDAAIYQTYLANPANQTFPGDANDPGNAPIFTHEDNTDHLTWVAEQLKWEKKRHHDMAAAGSKRSRGGSRKKFQGGSRGRKTGKKK